MKTRKLRELEVSEIGIGCMGFSYHYGVAPVLQAIRDAYAYGCIFFDTAESYGVSIGICPKTSYNGCSLQK